MTMINAARLVLSLCLLLVSTTTAFVSTPPSNSNSNSDNTSPNAGDTKPILVVGATGRVGRLVVKQLLQQNRPVRALVRNTTKAQHVFAGELRNTNNNNNSNAIDFVTADLGYYDDARYAAILEEAVEGCQCIISVSGTLRFSKWSDFLPWRLFRSNVTSWCNDDRRHPYYPNYQAQELLVDLAAKHNVSRFVRLTGLTVGLPAFNLVSILFSGLLSMTSRYHALTEQYLSESAVPHVILRPGGLSNSERDAAVTSLQVDSSGVLPPPARVGRSDVASLAIAACDPSILPLDNDFTLAVRWVGQVAPKTQGTMEDGCSSAEACLEGIANKADKGIVEFQQPKRIKPYGAAVGLFFYSAAAISVKVGSMLLRTFLRIFRRL